MLRSILFCSSMSFIIAVCATGQNHAVWVIDSAEEWRQNGAESEGLIFDNGFAEPTGDTGHYRSITRTFENRRSAMSIVLKPSPVWHNWNETVNIGPSNLGDAPVVLTLGPDNYWMFGRYGSSGKRENFTAEDAALDGFDIPLKTTPFPNQFDAPGGLKKGLRGYHAWQSRDMVNWVHHGPVTEGFARWVTTAEFADGKAYIYYDFPNDQDPHLYVDGDLTDGTPGTNAGMAFKDPSDGSDCAVIRDLEGNFHLIYEDWSPIDASRHSWDSPLAGHAVSPDGMGNFEILPPVVDERTRPTGRFDEYPHPHWHASDPENYPGKPVMTDVSKDRIKAGEIRAFGTYEVHEPEQNAFGDWAAISVGGQYYLFCDYHPVKDKIRVAWFTSPDINKPFQRVGEIGRGHPDPDITFAEGQFYLITQMENDYVSPGPWVEKVEVRVGVDTDNDGSMDTWTDWTEVRETYDYIKGFSKQVKRNPASMDLDTLPAGFGFRFEIRTEDMTENMSEPILDSVEMSFE